MIIISIKDGNILPWFIHRQKPEAAGKMLTKIYTCGILASFLCFID
jgi:hypothetical protein